MSVDQIVLSVLPGLLSGAITTTAGALTGYLVGRIRREGKKSKALEDGVKGLLRVQIIDQGMHYLAEGDIPPYGVETLRLCYDPYVALGDGDPSVAHIIRKCESLPLRHVSEE